jgi:pimeloyl-ACP methyl ester carboxylesterase
VRATTRPILAAFLTVLAAVATVPARPGAARAARDAAPAWRACAEDRRAQCAQLRVPVDWADPYGPTIAVALARRPAADPKTRIGTLLVNPGGPGGSGVDFALDSAYFFSPALRRRFDIVGFDPRGVARSTPILCTTKLVDAAPAAVPGSVQAYAAAVGHNRRLAADCARRTGPLFGHADTLSVVRDMEAVRAALGEEQISFYGASYGTLLGAQYAERYPQRVRALVLDSVMDHTADTAGFLAAETDAAQDSFDEFVAWCARRKECAMHGRDVRKLWAGLRDSARRGTLRDPFEPSLRLTEFDLLGVAFGSFYDPQWHSLAIFIEKAVAGTVARRSRALPEASEHSFPAIFCDDWRLPVTGYAGLRDHLAVLARRGPQMPYSPLALSSIVSCLGWDRTTDNPQRPLAPARGGPVLVVNARHDPATPYAWARGVATQLGPAATLFTYDGWGHTVYGRSDCVTGAIDRHLLALRPPAAGASCPGVEPEAAGIGDVGRSPRVVPGVPYR